ncbi:DUF3164 family protein [Pseudomonas sp. FP833]|uniref:DUF3164 family protein n=1 Tax=Pseudomonas sp. FP833 TaxID=2954102 RepID=UPI0027332AA8|nr:DUF3164 family protein [Pseudomonas sp. FP833]WLI50639.1 DUF3164 family protein [Pseudomonas sp. FP833]
MTQQQPIPEGYRRDAQNRLVHESQIKEIDRLRDEMVMNLFRRAQATSLALAQFKSAVFDEIEAFIELSANEYGVTVGGKKGNASLYSFDGRYRIQRAIQESTAFDERLQAARALIDECLLDWMAGARPEVVTLVNDAFRTDTKGEIRTARVLALRRLNITDERWQRAMQAIGDACMVIGSKTYFRVHERSDETGEYLPISLNIAGV